MPISREAPDDLLSLYVHLASSRGSAIPLQSLREQLGTGIDRLIGIGAASRGRTLSIVKCSACFEDHPAEVEYDAATGRSSIFCPEAGRVWIENRDLGTLNVNQNWLPDQLANALSIAPSPPRRTIIDGAAWLLGDTVIGSTRISFALAFSIRGMAEIEQLIEGLGRRQPLELGVLLAAGCELPSLINKASKYRVVDIEEFVTLDCSTVRIDREILGAGSEALLRVGLVEFSATAVGLQCNNKSCTSSRPVAVVVNLYEQITRS